MPENMGNSAVATGLEKVSFHLNPKERQCKECSSEVKSLSHVQLFATPWTVAYQASLSMGFSRQEYWNGLPCLSPGHLAHPGIKPASPVSPALSGGLFTCSATWEATGISEQILPI